MSRLWRLAQAAAARLDGRGAAVTLLFVASACMLVAGPAAPSAAGPTRGNEAAAGLGSPPTVAVGATDCDRNRDFYARLQTRGPRAARPGNSAWTDSSCINDDGVCSGSCDSQNDNDCLILESLIRTLDRSSNRISFALIIAALILASSFLVPRQGALQSFGIVGYVIATIFGFWLLISILRGGRL